MKTEELLARIKQRLAEAHGPRLRGVILYGSEARGEAGPDSDVDVLVLLDEPIEFGRDLETNIKALSSLSAELGRPISPNPTSPERYENYDCPLYRAIHKEGIPA